MQYLLQRLQCLWLALLLGLFTPIATAGAADSAFQATISFSEQVAVLGAAPCFANGSIYGTGVSPTLHNDSVSLRSTDCINPLSATLFGFSSSTAVLTTSRGDLFVVYAGILSSNGVITGTYMIHGGSGDFLDANGSGILLGFETIDFAAGTGVGQIKLKGTLSY